MTNNIYSAYHYACKTKADREAMEKIVPEAYTAAQKAVWGNIGDIKYTTRTSVPGGCYWCDGKTIAKSELTKVYEMLIKGDLQSIDMNLYNSCIEENGSCGLFGLDKEKEIFRIPMLNDVYLKMGQDFESFKAESLPNITGWFNNGYLISETNGKNSGGSIKTPYTATASRYGGSDPSAGWGGGFSFDASLSSSAYQEDAKVNPDYVKYRACIVLFLTEKEMSIVNWTNQLNSQTNELKEELKKYGATTLTYWE